jgi:cell wall assembly regulator SMI1
MGVQDAWERIDRWLAGNAPRLRAGAGPSVSTSDIDAVVSELGLSLPYDLVSLWRKLDGVRTDLLQCLIPPGYEPLTAAGSLRCWRRHRALQYDWYPVELHSQLDEFLARLAAAPAGSCTTEQVWVSAWLPVASDVHGRCLVVDLRDGPRRGCVMRYAVDHGCEGPLWPGVAAMLDDVALSLEDGVWAGEMYRKVDEHGRLYWSEQRPDEGLYERWARRMP